MGNDRWDYRSVGCSCRFTIMCASIILNSIEEVPTVPIPKEPLLVDPYGIWSRTSERLNNRHPCRSATQTTVWWGPFVARRLCLSIPSACMAWTRPLTWRKVSHCRVIQRLGSIEWLFLPIYIVLGGYIRPKSNAPSCCTDETRWELLMFELLNKFGSFQYRHPVDPQSPVASPEMSPPVAKSLVTAQYSLDLPHLFSSRPPLIPYLQS